MYAGEPYYQQDRGARFYLYWDPDELCWTINKILVGAPPNCWYRVGGGIEGNYFAYGVYSGNPIAASYTPVSAVRTLMGAGI